MTARKPYRLSIVIPEAVDRQLREMAARQGRSISNLAAHLLREALQAGEGDGRP